MCGSLLNDKREKKEKIPFFFSIDTFDVGVVGY